MKFLRSGGKFITTTKDLKCFENTAQSTEHTILCTIKFQHSLHYCLQKLFHHRWREMLIKNYLRFNIFTKKKLWWCKKLTTAGLKCAHRSNEVNLRKTPSWAFWEGTHIYIHTRIRDECGMNAGPGGQTLCTLVYYLGLGRLDQQKGDFAWFSCVQCVHNGNIPCVHSKKIQNKKFKNVL